MINIESLPTSAEKSGRFVLHCIQIRPKKSCSTHEYYKMFQVYDKNETPLAFPVKVSGVVRFKMPVGGYARQLFVLTTGWFSIGSYVS